MRTIHNYRICIEEHGTSHFFNRSAVAKHIFGAISRVSRSSKCTKIVGGCFAPDPLGELTALPRPPSWNQGEGPYF